MRPKTFAADRERIPVAVLFIRRRARTAAAHEASGEVEGAQAAAKLAIPGLLPDIRQRLLVNLTDHVGQDLLALRIHILGVRVQK